jgi:hypothetical protein|tara:strand:- start:9130 stop:9684 length:555 start_codon:yes stop_codon:yes gene_type:complete
MPKKIAIVLHHTAIRLSKHPKQFDLVNLLHRDRWNFRSSLGLYGGYQYLIEADGIVGQYRAEEERAAHTSVVGYDYNGNSIGICLAGDLRYDKPSAAQIRSLTTLLLDIQRRHGIPSHKVYLHRELKGTACPVIDLRELIERQHQSDLKRRLKLLQSVLPRARGARKRLILRVIERIKRLFNVI